MILLTRFRSDENGTFGNLSDDTGNQYCYTVELPWCDNKTDVSCIPEGVYQVEAYQSPKHGDVWKIMGTAPRQNIEIHPANDIADLLGCIGVGDSLGNVNGLPAVLNSQKTFSMLKSTLPSNFQLTIRSGIL